MGAGAGAEGGGQNASPGGPPGYASGAGDERMDRGPQTWLDYGEGYRRAQCAAIAKPQAMRKLPK